jgi:hypothetical protein
VRAAQGAGADGGDLGDVHVPAGDGVLGGRESVRTVMLQWWRNTEVNDPRKLPHRLLPG